MDMQLKHQDRQKSFCAGHTRSDLEPRSLAKPCLHPGQQAHTVQLTIFAATEIKVLLAQVVFPGVRE